MSQKSHVKNRQNLTWPSTRVIPFLMTGQIFLTGQKIKYTLLFKRGIHKTIIVGIKYKTNVLILASLRYFPCRLYPEMSRGNKNPMQTDIAYMRDIYTS